MPSALVVMLTTVGKNLPKTKYDIMDYQNTPLVTCLLCMCVWYQFI